MSIWNKILLGFIIIASMGFAYLAARTLKTHQAWRESAQKFEKAIAQVQKDKIALAEGIQEGEEKEDGIRQVRRDLAKLLLGRGRVWRDVVPGQVDAASGQVMVAIDSPDPHQIGKGMIIYVFEEKPILEGGKYLGEFKVEAVDQKQVQLKSLAKLDREIAGKKTEQDQIDRLVQSRGPWTLRERLPADNPDLFADLDEDRLREMIPESLLPEFLKDGKPAEADDPDDRIDPETKNYVRKLYDYRAMLRNLEVARTVLVDLIVAEHRSKKAVDDSLADAEKQNAFHKKTITEEEARKTKITAELAAVVANLADVDTALADVNSKVATAISTIQGMVSEIAKLQLDATRRINSRTQALMQAGTGQ